MPGNDSFTEVLLHLDGSTGSTTITDDAVGGALTWGATGDAELHTAHKKFGTASCYFPTGDGTADHQVYEASSEVIDFGTGDFTIDFWARFESIYASEDILELTATGGDPLKIRLSGPDLRLEAYTTDSTEIVLSRSLDGVVSDETWAHIAYVRNGADLKLFVDGVQQGATYNISTKEFPAYNDDKFLGNDVLPPT